MKTTACLIIGKYNALIYKMVVAVAICASQRMLCKFWVLSSLELILIQKHTKNGWYAQYKIISLEPDMCEVVILNFWKLMNERKCLCHFKTDRHSTYDWNVHSFDVSILSMSFVNFAWYSRIETFQVLRNIPNGI